MLRNVLIAAAAASLAMSSPVFAASQAATAAAKAAADAQKVLDAAKNNQCSTLSSSALKKACEALVETASNNRGNGVGRGHCKDNGRGHEVGNGRGHDRDDDCSVSAG